jgi:hypothetical protein
MWPSDGDSGEVSSERLQSDQGPQAFIREIARRAKSTPKGGQMVTSNDLLQELKQEAQTTRRYLLTWMLPR